MVEVKTSHASWELETNCRLTVGWDDFGSLMGLQMATCDPENGWEALKMLRGPRGAKSHILIGYFSRGDKGERQKLHPGTGYDLPSAV